MPRLGFYAPLIGMKARAGVMVQMVMSAEGEDSRVELRWP
jgi:hypothetical protein